MGNFVSAHAGDFPEVSQPEDVAFVDQCLGRMRMLNPSTDSPRALYDGASVAFLHTESGHWLASTSTGSLLPAEHHSTASQYRVRYVNATRFELLRSKAPLSINGCSFFEWVMEPKHHYAEGLAACAVADPDDDARVPLRLSKSSPHRWYTSSSQFAPDDWDRLLPLVVSAPPAVPSPQPVRSGVSDRRTKKQEVSKATAPKQKATAVTSEKAAAVPAPSQPTSAVSTVGAVEITAQQQAPVSASVPATAVVKTQVATSHAASSTSTSTSTTKQVATKESSVKSTTAPPASHDSVTKADAVETTSKPKARPGDVRLFNRWWMFVVFGVFVTLITLGLCTLYTRYGKRETPELASGVPVAGASGLLVPATSSPPASDGAKDTTGKSK
jgi:hypothetical protein